MSLSHLCNKSKSNTFGKKFTKIFTMRRIPAEPELFTPQPKKSATKYREHNSERKLPKPLYDDEEFQKEILSPRKLATSYNNVVDAIVNLSFGIENINRVIKQINEYKTKLLPTHASIKQINDLILVAARSPFPIIELLYQIFFEMAKKISPSYDQIATIVESFRELEESIMEQNENSIPDDLRCPLATIQNQLKIYYLEDF